ncbi:DUF1572 domain-containing protein [Olivibacter ginsenosidimutans]|uniref:DUF1572 domain-containing protein n=2 Tax=Olivibacter ginsenosidimutans TaxID=1176537 RepID=A0ABP9AYP9_9SPHI
MNTYLESLIKQFNYYKMLGEKAMDQVPEEKLSWQYNENSNSIAIIVNHLVGNMLSRFTDFLTADGEKPWRNRDTEFEESLSGRTELMAHWHKGWQCLLTTVEQLTADQLQAIVYIRNDGHTVIEALNRQLAHYAYHIGQIVYIAKMVRDNDWQSLSIPRHKSSNYNTRKFAQEKGKRHFTDDL